MKILFLYSSRRIAESCDNNSWLFQKAGQKYNHNSQDGYFTLLSRMKKAGIITDLTNVYESNIEPGIANFIPGAKNYVIPRLTHEIMDFLVDSDTIIFVRGGFKHWAELLLPFKNTNWLLVYAANTGRDKWPWWDVVFDDLNLSNQIDKHERYHFPFVKPINENIFHPKELTDPGSWDICIGASAIHDKKGQWRTVQLLEKYQEKYGRTLKAVMPGGLRKGTQTNKMIESDYFKRNVHLPGNLSRNELAYVFNQCKLFLHLGAGGQNDRSILEAFACGLKVGYLNRSRFTPLLKKDIFNVTYFDEKSSIESHAELLRVILDMIKSEKKTPFLKRKEIGAIYKKDMGMYSTTFPSISKLFRLIDGTKPCIGIKEKIANELTQFTQSL